MRKINLIAAVIAVILSVAGCQKAATKTSSDAAGYYRLGAMSVNMIESSLEKLPSDVKGVELTITDPNPDLSEISQIMDNYEDILFKLDLSKCTAMTSIEDYAFYNCSGLTSVTIGKGVTSIGDSAFDGCQSLVSITIPDSVRSIGDSTFEECIGLTVKINAVTPPAVGSDAFNLSVLIIVPAESVAKYKDAYNWSEYVPCIYGSDKVKGDFIMDGTTLIRLYNRTKTEIVIPNSVTSIGKWAFYGCESLKSVTIGKGVTSIGEGAFFGCESIPTVKINAVNPPVVGPGAIETTFILVPTKSVDKYKEADRWSQHDFFIHGLDKVKGDFIMDGTTLIRLYNRTKTEIVIPDGVTSIGDYAFAGCIGLRSVTIGKGVTNIGDGAFYGCREMTTLTVKAIDPPTFGEDMLYTCDSLTAIYVPSSSVNAYKQAEGWSDYSDIIQGKKF